MKLVRFVAKKSGTEYWIATCEGETELEYCKGSGFEPSRFRNKDGMSFIVRSGEKADAIKLLFLCSEWDAVEDGPEEEEAPVNGFTSEYANREEVLLLSGEELRNAAGRAAVRVGKSSVVARSKALTKEQKQALVWLGQWPDGPVAMPGTTAGELTTEEKLAKFEELMTIFGNRSSQIDPEQIEETVQKAVDEGLKRHKQTIEVKRFDGTTVNVGKQHKTFPLLLKLASLGEDTMLVGPAGSGKTTCVSKVAEALGLEFYCQSVGMQTTKSDLVGYKDATGTYQFTILYIAYKNGGVYLLDEVDAGNANVLTILNALLANHVYYFPNGEKVERHKNFVCFAAANTYGRGADRMYVGRNQLDAATLDRFAVVDFDYDEELETELSGNDSWTRHVQKVRKAVFDLRERVVVSPRASIKGSRFIDSGGEWKQAEELYIWKGIPKEIKDKVVANC